TIGTLLALAALGTILAAFGALVASRTISNVGRLKAVGVGVYWDGSCTNPVSSIDWGILDPGGTKSVTVYIKNEGNVQLKLSMATSNWNPSSASSYITLSWDRQNYVLAAGSVVSAVLTLSVSSSISGVTSFSFDITITGTEYP
ncbi:MAG: hypothetical protein QXR45_12815, partial [Candidatus Bathyarchaeia archaeon]